MLDEIGSAIAGYLSGRETMRFKTIGLTSFLIGLLFFLFVLAKELLFFSHNPLSINDVLVLSGLSFFIAVLTFAVLSFAKWNNQRRGKTTQP